MRLPKRLAGLALSLALCLSLIPTATHAAGFTRSRTYTPGMFTDVADNHWAADAIKDVYELGLMNGSNTEGTAFNPTGMYNVAQALTIAARMHNIYNGGDGKLESSNPWYQSAVNYCLNHGIITSGQFNNYDRNVTRAEMAMLIVAALPNDYWTPINSISQLPDVSANTEYHSAIFKLYNAGILTGSDPEYGTFHPMAYITRAEVAAIVARCADSSLRQSLSLKPPSQREAPKLVTDQYEGYWAVSSGLMLYQDTESHLWGYLDPLTGEKSIPAQYREAKAFDNGYAAVKLESKWGMIDAGGTLTVPMNYYSIDSIENYGVYSARVEYGSKRCIIIGGTIVSDHVYEAVTCNGLYIFGRTGTDSYDILDMSGKKLTHVTGALNFARYSPLFKVREGNKWALATEEGKITDAIYDSIDLYDYSTLALAKYGNQWALCGQNGIVNGLEMGIATYRGITGDYAIVKKDNQYAIADTNGILSDFSSEEADYVQIVGNMLFARISYRSNWRFAYDRTTGETFTTFAGGNNDDGYILMTDGTYIMTDGTRCSSINNIANKYFTFTTLDGKYGLLHDGKVVSEGIYNSPEEAISAYGYYKFSEENRKPVLVYGNDIDGFNPVIQYYKNNLYYDEIKYIGEGYYACKFNTDWFILHA